MAPSTPSPPARDRAAATSGEGVKPTMGSSMPSCWQMRVRMDVVYTVSPACVDDLPASISFHEPRELRVHGVLERRVERVVDRREDHARVEVIASLKPLGRRLRRDLAPALTTAEEDAQPT